MKLLVTGGAGYIGSFMTKRLLDDGHSIIVIDSLDRGNKNIVDSRAQFVEGNFQDKLFIDTFFSQNNIDAVLHFAGFIAMGESMREPAMYFINNTFAPVHILEAMMKNNVKHFIFSSTAGVYGNPIKVPIPEDHPKNPENPYGESKLMTERILHWYNKIYGINSVCLRYFNACGASLDSSMGESHRPETHIIPKAIQAALTNQPFQLFGEDYNTPDKTCVRDYIHVIDLVDAHVLALKKLTTGGGEHVYNVGTGKGYSNKEVIAMVKKISGIDFQVVVSPRRPGDADTLVADVAKIQKDLGFAPKYSDLETIVKTAWEWHSKSFSTKSQSTLD